MAGSFHFDSRQEPTCVSKHSVRTSVVEVKGAVSIYIISVNTSKHQDAFAKPPPSDIATSQYILGTTSLLPVLLSSMPAVRL